MPAESICLLNSARAAHHLFGFFEFGLAAIVRPTARATTKDGNFLLPFAAMVIECAEQHCEGAGELASLAQEIHALDALL
jgi:hypothetical protein